jgi:hypothetical protein
MKIGGGNNGVMQYGKWRNGLWQLKRNILRENKIFQ